MFRPILICCLIFCSLNLAAQDKKSVSLEDIFKSSQFAAQPGDSYAWMKNDLFYSSLEPNEAGLLELVRYEVKSGKKESVIIKAEELIDPKVKDADSLAKKQIEISDYFFSEDESKVVLSGLFKPRYRHSYSQQVWVFDIKTRKLSLIKNGTSVFIPTLSPDGSKIAYVFDNNLYYTNLSDLKETQVTTDGKWNAVINGLPDWVYEEEFSFDRAYEWSADGKKIAFIKFDESRVKLFSMEMYGTLYPTKYEYKYPKAGEENALVKVMVYNVTSGEMLESDIGKETDIYIPRIHWTNDPDKLIVFRMNRLQNQLDLISIDGKTGKNMGYLYQEKSEKFIEITDNYAFLKNGSQWIWSSDKDGYTHLYLMDISGKLINQVTKGNWDVTAFLGADEKRQIVYFQSTKEGSEQKHIYSVSFDGKNMKQLTIETGTHDATFSSACSYYLLNSSSCASVPQARLFSADGKMIRVLQDNKKLETNLAGFRISVPEFFTFTTSENVELKGWMIKPQDFDPQKKYPVLMYVYGGPGAQTVVNQWSGRNYLWFQYLASQGYIIASVDNRGTGGRGAAFRPSTYKQMGKLETLDQIESAKYFGSLSYVDSKRIGIWGWSYGGYMSALCITKGAEVFKCAISVAPVTTWRYYDSIYSERYLQTPQLNPEGYDENSPVKFAGKIKGKYLLVHGTADDNVHFQNSIDFSDALIKANVDFDEMFYPNRNHGIYGNNASFHLYSKMSRFILNNL